MDEVDTGAALARDAAALLAEHGLVDDPAELEFEPLTGGVSSTLLRVRAPAAGASWCAKRPLVRLRVAGDWQVSPERSRAEARWLEAVGAWFPARVPALVAHRPETHLLLMQDLPPPRWRCWKPDLLDGRIDPALGPEIGTFLGAVQRRAEAAPELAEAFAHAPLFHALRVRPFLFATAEAHPDRAARLRALADALADAPATLVHGDLSPKNLLVDDDGAFVLLDAECACWTAAHFDAAFLLSHLMLKWAHRPAAAPALRALAEGFHGAWLAARGEAVDGAVARACVELVPALLLARIDGLSPVDYLGAERATRVRSFARSQLVAAPAGLERLLERWDRAMGEID